MELNEKIYNVLIITFQKIITDPVFIIYFHSTNDSSNKATVKPIRLIKKICKCRTEMC